VVNYNQSTTVDPTQNYSQYGTVTPVAQYNTTGATYSRKIDVTSHATPNQQAYPRFGTTTTVSFSRIDDMTNSALGILSRAE
jgi:hypothetical protein